MVARAIWKGTISFGLVQIPVELVSAEARHGGVSFTMLDQRDMAKVGYERVNKETGAPVPWEEVVKGYEIEDGEFVVLDESDFARANVEATQTVDIVHFAGADELDWLYCEKPYYLRPTKRGLKAYALLRDTLRETNKVGIAKVVIRARQHIAALVPRGEALALELLRFADEIRDRHELELPESDASQLGVSALEKQMAEQLVEGMTRPLDLGQFKDEYRDDLLRIIEEKAQRGDVNVVTEPTAVERPEARELDLMAMLKQSLSATGERAAPAEASEIGANKRASRKTATQKTASDETASRKTATRKTASQKRR
jgi:DNA end-binding protein Ku